MSEILHSRNRARIAVGMQSENNVISKLVRVKADTKTNTMRTAVLSGLGLNVTVAAGKQKPIAMNIKRRIIGTRGRQKGEPMSDLIDRQAAIDDLRGKDPSQIWDTADIEVWINELPSAHCDNCPYPDDYDGRVQVVRCKDCAAAERTSSSNADRCYCLVNGNYWNADDYCSYGESYTESEDDKRRNVHE